MFFSDRHEPSLVTKGFFLSAIWIALFVAAAISLPWTGDPPKVFAPYVLDGDPGRQGVLLFCLGLYVVRVTVTSVVFLKRKLVWQEALIITPLMTTVILAFAWKGGSNAAPLGFLEIGGLAINFIGSYLNSMSEYQRHAFKSDPTNQGKLYTEGLFRHTRNINYFGDVLLFTGAALVTGLATMLAVPIAMATVFVFVIIPRKDTYMADKYGAEFQSYSMRTKKLVPFVY